jgi:hypothetical protein
MKCHRSLLAGTSRDCVQVAEKMELIFLVVENPHQDRELNGHREGTCRNDKASILMSFLQSQLRSITCFEFSHLG